ncbi:unnamed protein product [Caenorhabditis brenneri]
MNFQKMEPSDDAPSQLLTLPADLQQEIFDYLSPIDIAIFSFCSKSSFQVAKNVKKAQKMEMYIDQAAERTATIYYKPQGRFMFKAVNKSSNKNVENYDQTVGKVRTCELSFGIRILRANYLDFARELRTYWSDEAQGFVELVKHLVEVFGIVLISYIRTCPHYGMQLKLLTKEELCEMHSAYNYRPFLDWLTREYKGEVSKMEFGAQYLNSNSKQKYLLDAGKIAKKRLQFYSTWLPNLEYQFNYTVDFLQIGAEWINIDHLVQLSHQIKKLEITRCSLTNSCLNRFIKNWIKSGEDWKLKDFDVEFQDINLNEVLAGIEYQKLNEEEYYSFIIDEGEGTLYFNHGYVIERRIKNDQMIIPNKDDRQDSLRIIIAPKSFKKDQFFF